MVSSAWGGMLVSVFEFSSLPHFEMWIRWDIVALGVLAAVGAVSSFRQVDRQVLKRSSPLWTI